MCAKSNHQPFQQSPAKHLAGHGCHACAEEARDAHRRTSGHNTKSWISKAKEVHGDRYDYSCTVYDGHHEKVKIGCEFHGFFELEHAYQHIETERRRGCPECALRDSKHSIAIERWLIESNYNFIKEWSHSGCIDEKRLRFDFYLPLFNACIEFDGDQHFRLGPWGTDEEDIQYNFIKGRRRDAIKSIWCLKNGVRLIRITSEVPVSELEDYLASQIPKSLYTGNVEVRYNKDEASLVTSMGVEAYLNDLRYWGEIAKKLKKTNLDWLAKIPERILGKKGACKTDCISVDPNASGSPKF